MLHRFFKKHIIKVSGDGSIYTPTIRINQPVRPVNFVSRSEPVFSYQRANSQPS